MAWKGTVWRVAIGALRLAAGIIEEDVGRIERRGRAGCVIINGIIEALAIAIRVLIVLTRVVGKVTIIQRR
jgi:hypothetical protein